MDDVKLCEKCNCAKSKNKERYCIKCRKEVLQELKGILSPVFGHGFRSDEKKENVYDTKYGIDR